MKLDTLIIIGAPRSGTNMLRNVLTSFSGVATWPSDEINYIWRHGNARYPSDEFPPELATPKVQRYIRRRFDWVANRYSAHVVVEKTCANSLRVPFVDRVLPEARYVFIRRDGLDSVASAMKRWRAELDIPYLARKARFVPAADLPYYAARYLGSRMYRLFSPGRRLAFWGPQLSSMQALLQQHSLEEVCALQWRQCVDLAESAFKEMPEDKVCTVGYENFVRAPETELRRIVDFCGLEATDEELGVAVSGVSACSVGKGRQELGATLAAHLSLLIADTQRRLGYG